MHENLSTAKVGEHILRSYSISSIWALSDIENKYDAHKGEDWMNF